MIDTQLVAPNTTITAKGDGNPVPVDEAVSRVFLVLLNITSIIEQESIELSIFGSVDGQTWDPKPLLTFPQKFYRGETPLLLDLTAHPDIKALRAHWEVNRWGRGPEQPMFEIGVGLKEVPAEMLQQVGV
ncbi:MAG TPA: hypothetical protein VG897_11615 [Terriglobales bacterium]|nr:hypothetical protein [Terriglobales bacterium]